MRKDYCKNKIFRNQIGFMKMRENSKRILKIFYQVNRQIKLILSNNKKIFKKSNKKQNMMKIKNYSKIHFF